MDEDYSDPGSFWQTDELAFNIMLSVVVKRTEESQRADLFV